jgi:hypothetical protein
VDFLRLINAVSITTGLKQAISGSSEPVDILNSFVSTIKVQLNRIGVVAFGK